MIVDSLTNAKIYYSIDKNIEIGLKFLETISTDIELGTYQLNDKVKVMVTEYDTKVINPEIFEAHKIAIDIQYPIIGLEAIEWSPLEGMNRTTEYDNNKDIVFYDKPSQKTKVILGKGIFGIFFHKDAHNPALAANGISQKIKKATIKILAG